MPTPDWNELTLFAIALAEASATAILPNFRRNTAVEDKGAAISIPSPRATGRASAPSAA